MNNKLRIALSAAALAAAALASGTAAARDNISFSISFGTPYVPAPAYVYAPAPVYFHPPPVVYARPVYAPPRVVYYNTPPGHARHWDKHRGHRGHGHRHGR
jgi:hypothetical protein